MALVALVTAVAVVAVVGLVGWTSTRGDLRYAQRQTDDLSYQLDSVRAGFPISIASLTFDAGLPTGEVTFEMEPTGTSAYCTGVCRDENHSFELVADLTARDAGYEVHPTMVRSGSMEDGSFEFADGAWAATLLITGWHCTDTGTEFGVDGVLSLEVSSVHLDDAGRLAYGYTGTYSEVASDPACGEPFELDWDVTLTP